MPGEDLTIMSPERQLRVPLSCQDQRLDMFLTKQFSGYSRAFMQRWLKAGRVTVEGRIEKSHRRLQAGELVIISLPPPPRDSPLPQEIPLNILYEDRAILIVDKPPGITVHPASPEQTHTLLNALLFHTPHLSSLGTPLRRGIVHRLDKDTSGVLLVAKTDSAHRHLARQFKERTVQKEYRALVRGKPPRERGKLDYPIGRDSRRRTAMKVRYLGGRPAITEYEVLKSFRDCSLLRLYLKTGRTHQIRLHLAQLGCPVLGDRQYGERKEKGVKDFPAARQMLHAYRLRFRHPVTEEEVEFVAPVPPDMLLLLESLRARENTAL